MVLLNENDVNWLLLNAKVDNIINLYVSLLVLFLFYSLPTAAMCPSGSSPPHCFYYYNIIFKYNITFIKLY